VGVPNLGQKPLPRAFKVFSLRAAAFAMLAIAVFGGGPLRAEDDEFGGPAPFPAGPLRRLDDALKTYGIRPSFSYTSDVFGNPSGGIRRGGIYESRLDCGIEANLGKLVGWSDAKFHANVINSNGDGLSREYLGNLMTVSNIEALSHTRLYELWIEQTFGKKSSGCESASSAPTPNSTLANMPAACSTPLSAGRGSQASIFPPAVRPSR
jgi:carbohydrate-selective porin OprB